MVWSQNARLQVVLLKILEVLFHLLLTSVVAGENFNDVLISIPF